MLRIIDRIRSLPVTSSVVRFSTGFHLLRQKLDEWNKLAHKNNHMRDLEIEVAQHIQRWTKLELQFWRECLNQSYERMEEKGCKYWFFIYNLVHEYLFEPKDQFASCDLTDITAVEKCFGTDEVTNVVESKPQKRLKSNDVVGVLKQFIESSNFAEYPLRMSLLKSFELYLHRFNGHTKRRDNLIKILHNLHSYYDQFRVAIAERVKAIRAPIEKKLKEFVKIESYNKDLSYFSMKSNIAKVHRNLHKYLKEFENNLNEKIVAVFQLKELNFSVEKEKVNESYVNPCTVDAKCFIAPTKLIENMTTTETTPSEPAKTDLLSRIPNFFGGSRNIVREVIVQSPFPKLISNLEALLADHIETCEYLRKLEVDRKQEKPKQKVQAKQILSQKRKCLSDVYKVLANLGLNFRTGLMESSLREEIIDLKIQPFCVRTMTLDAKHQAINQHFVDIIDNLDSYYAKCVFKLKLLQTVLLTPHADLGLQHLERIKGFSIDLYLLVQSQRIEVSEMVKRVHDLRQQIAQINELSRCAGNDLERHSFKQLTSKCSFVKDSLVKICNVFHQYIILLKSVPTDGDTNCQIFEGQEPFTQSSGLYLRIKEMCSAILSKSTQLLAEVERSSNIVFHCYETVASLEGRFNEVVVALESLSQEFQCDGRDMVIGKPVAELLAQIESSRHEQAADNQVDDAAESEADTERKLENIVYCLLKPMEKIYKKHSKPKKIRPNVNATSVPDETVTEADDSDSIEENHLKTKINYELMSELETLDVEKVVRKLADILLTMQCGKPGHVSNVLQKVVRILPVLEQYQLFCKYFLVQQIGAHKVSTKMLSVMLTVFVELGSKGFCIPPDLMEDDDGESKQNEGKRGEGFGLDDGTGENDVSDK